MIWDEEESKNKLIIGIVSNQQITFQGKYRDNDKCQRYIEKYMVKYVLKCKDNHRKNPNNNQKYDA